jgi:nucleoside-diphosphate-sugar epimerase
MIINENDLILVTGSNGFIGSRVVGILLERGFKNIRCFVRPSSNIDRLKEVIAPYSEKARVEIAEGNLLSRADCERIAKGVSVLYHLAAGIDKSFAGAFMNSVVTTRNLLDAILQDNNLKRFVNISSFAVYSNMSMKRGALLDETCEIIDKPQIRGEAYCYGKVKQDELLLEYSRKYGISYAILRPGAVIGPGKKGITGRVGIDTFGLYIHLGGPNKIPFTYVDNCAEAIVLAGINKEADGQIFNIVDDNLPSSRQFLRMYKKQVRKFRSLYVPYSLAYLFCSLWEWYSEWSQGQLPPVFNRSRCAAEWKGNRYSNEKLKRLLGWKPRVPMKKALKKYFDYQKSAGVQA